MKKFVTLKKTVIIGIICFISAVVLTLAGIYVFAGKTFFKLSQIDLLINKYFYGDVAEEDLNTGIFEGYVSALGDKYSSYLPPSDAKEKFDSFEGYENGLGMTVFVHPDNKDFCVLKVCENGPADNAGIMPGDEITSVGGVEINEDNLENAYKKFSGEIGEKISITLLRNGETNKTEITVSKYDFQSVYYRTVGNYGYIQIDEFNTATVSQFKNAINSLIGDGVKGFIFDVTGNGGGTVDSAAEILDYILPSGNIISVENSSGKKTVLYKSDDSEISLPMVVLTDGQSASASELFAISIRDFEKGIIVGQKTYGKGVMQKTFMLFDGSSVKFTVGKFFSKNGVNYDGVGIEPDVKVTLNEYEGKYFYLLSDDENPYIKAAVGWLDENTK